LKLESITLLFDVNSLILDFDARAL